MTPAVTGAVEQIRAAFPDCPLTLREDGEGGAYVLLEDVPLGAPYVQATTWFGFHTTFPYPYADVYPHFVRADIARVDGKVLGEALSSGIFEGRPAIQISRKSNRLNPATDTALAKLIKVRHWLLARP